MSELKFEALPLTEPVQRALRENNYTTPSPIQAQAIPQLIEGKDLLGCAQTGTGKTAAFALPIIHLIATNFRPMRPKKVRAVVLTPTRELAVQVGNNFDKYGKYVEMRTVQIYGGVSAGPQTRALGKGVDVLIATPGRFLDLLNQKKMQLDEVEFLVLDEADRMLDMGFINDVRKIVRQLPAERQSLFFSATMSKPIISLASTILTDPVSVTIAPETTTAEKIEHRVCFLDPGNKKQLLADLIRDQVASSDENRVLVFNRTKHGANRLANDLSKLGIPADAIHGNKSQAARQRALNRFSEGHVPVLVATDVAARGIDVKGITLVINYDLPHEPEAYVHRIGRTARAGATGLALSFCTKAELADLLAIERLIRHEIPVFHKHAFHDAYLEEHRADRSVANKKNSPARGGGGGRNRQRTGGSQDRRGSKNRRAPQDRRGQSSQRRSDSQERSGEKAPHRGDSQDRRSGSEGGSGSAKRKFTGNRRPSRGRKPAANGPRRPSV